MTSSPTRFVDAPTARPAKLADGRFARRLTAILVQATEVFYKKGYAAASMRDLSRATGMSLAGLYYYFDSKEKLLYLIQKHTFESILRRLQPRLEGVTDPEQRLRIFIRNHLEYFLAHQQDMKVLSQEDEALHDSFGQEILAIKRQYYRTCYEIMEELKARRSLQFSTRLAVLSLFGMMNWIYTWHNARVDADAAQLARAMADIFLRGVFSTAPNRDGEALPTSTKSGLRKRRSTATDI